MSPIIPTPSRRRTSSFPSLAFSTAMEIPLKATPSPPSTSSSTSSSSSSDFSLSPSSFSPSYSPITDSSYASLSNPDWPKGDTLSPSSSPSASPARSNTVSGSQASCYISDDDLLDLEQLPLYNNIRVSEHFGAYGGQPHVAFEEKRERALPPPQPVSAKRQVWAKRRRSNKRTRVELGMSPIPESGE